jgi:multicomponent Na+:H+ antiporter subunit G
MQETVTAVLIVAGAILMFVAGLGIMRMPDLFLRMSATTKVATLGVGTILR